MSEHGDAIDKIEVGQRLKAIRENNKLTREQFAEKLGVTTNAVKDYESGKYGLSKNAIAMLREQFNVTADYLYFGDDNEQDDLYRRIENAPEHIKMELLVRLMVYFTEGKSRNFKQISDWKETSGIFKEVFYDALK